MTLGEKIVTRLLLTSFSVLMSVSMFAGASEESLSAQTAMKADVARLVEAAKKLNTLWPWQGAIPEVNQVAQHGKAVAPLLVVLLSDDPDMTKESTPQVNWYVQQQVALTLCKIYGVSEEVGHVYGNRAAPEENAGVKKFWLGKLAAK